MDGRRREVGTVTCALVVMWSMPRSAYPIFNLFDLFFSAVIVFSLTIIQLEQCFSANFSKVSDQRTGPILMEGCETLKFVWPNVLPKVS